MRRWKIFTICLGLLSIISRVDLIPGKNKEINSCKSFVIPCLIEMPAAEDILPEICQHLDLQDLYRTRAVCKQFKEAADKVLRQRGPELKALQVKKSFPGQAHPEPVSHSLKIHPRIALFFTSNKPSIKFYRSVSEEIFARFVYELPQDIQMIHTEGWKVLLDGEPIEIHNNYALGLFLPQPSTNMIDVRAFAMSRFWAVDEVSQNEINRFVKNIFTIPKNHLEDNHWGMIFLNTQMVAIEMDSPTFTNLGIAQRIRKRIGKIHGTTALWGSNVQWLTVLGVDGYYNKLVTSLVTRISGPRVQCWSIAIDLRDSTSQINKRIVQFRKRILINDKSIGLALITVGAINADDEAISNVNHFRAVFPGLSIMTYGIGSHKVKYCYNSLETKQDDPEGPNITYNEYHVCFMVVTYL